MQIRKCELMAQVEQAKAKHTREVERGDKDVREKERAQS